MNMYWMGCTALIGASLLGCSHENPLLTQPEEKVMKFLEAANHYAVEKTHLYGDMSSPYYQCLYYPEHYDNPFKKEPNPCGAFFASMSQYAEHSKIIEGVTKKDIEDPAVLKKWDHQLMDGFN